MPLQFPVINAPFSKPPVIPGVEIEGMSQELCQNIRGMSSLLRRPHGPGVLRQSRQIEQNKTVTVMSVLNAPLTVSQGRFSLHPLEGAVAPPGDVDKTLASPLSSKIAEWVKIRAPKWVVQTLSTGYRLQFAKRPPKFVKIIFSQAGGQAGDVLQQEILSLLDKGAIQEVPKSQMKYGFYSRYFLVSKKGGGLRPILDLRALNRYLSVFISKC